MIAQRVGVSALRRAAGKPSVFFNSQIPKIVAASHMSTTQIRPVATTKLNPDDGLELLAKQRLNRPVSPHLSIYKMEQTWFGASIWTRITGGGLSAAFYVYFGTYLVAPLLGWHVESQSLVAAFGALPLAAKGGLKFLVAWPFTFHFFNGIRHLTYDLVKGFSKPDIVRWGWIIWSTSLVSAAGLAFAW
ncbi:succinate dehydrogenase cytochrome b subunit [Colletotrichum navitas]|uniref:Succinate dehydrogenase cytochrome b subunit n=1 Tax=Colletotrichum navitas TaxID=681940 RepID=A0AAD8PKP3_9PEZI|nr:succinate dehydrogenase cytochrome b subunit [Colletotrichum navitas]KAK1569578.1 succinate dehydrogenase cytochrome b subunit [Colletotrichum navitas]